MPGAAEPRLIPVRRSDAPFTDADKAEFCVVGDDVREKNSASVRVITG